MSTNALAKLNEMREWSGPQQTQGLSDAVLTKFLATHPLLGLAIDEAHAAHMELRTSAPDALRAAETDTAAELQTGYVNFYDAAAVNPYIALAARGPWLVTAHGAVLHDSGGYGMLGMGHGPQAVLDTMSKPWVMANVMTPSFAQKRFEAKLRKELAHNRADGCPFDRFLCLNSGSESVTLALRISDIHTKSLTEPGAKHAGKVVKQLAMSGAFHGRTDRPARVSDSTLPKYSKHLASFRAHDSLITIPPNDIGALENAFAEAEANNWFIEVVLMEPVMGEGNPGNAIERAFYDKARELTLAHDSLLLVDSIQAGLRAQGCLSIVGYPGFEDAACPDLETWSKAINAGQYPLSVLGLNDRTSGVYQRGVYGNTMTTNPRALEVACTVLDLVSDDLRVNIQERGKEFVAKLKTLQAEFPESIVKVQGTGLLLCAELDPATLEVVGFGGVEEWCRRQGMGVIHGGKNALRFTPHFGITSDEIDLVVDILRQALRHFAAKRPSTAAHHAHA